MAFHLCISLYPEKRERRYQELLFCLQQNLKLKSIEKIHIFDEGGTHADLSKISPKIQTYPIESRPTYQDFFNFSKQHLHSQKVIVANSDIFFDSSLDLLLKRDFKKTVYALTRYNLLPYPDNRGVVWKRNHGSQDCWIFEAPLCDFFADIKLGWYGCDNWIAYEMSKAGLSVLNPSLTVFSWHVHENAQKEKNGVPMGAGSYHSLIRDEKGNWLKGKMLPFCY